MFFTERLMLRALDIDCDTRVMTKYFNDVDYMLAMTIDAPKPTSMSECKKWFEKFIKDGKENGFPRLAICERPSPDEMPDQLRDDDDLFLKDGKARYPAIGLLNLHTSSFSWTAKKISFGIMLDRKHQGAGLGTEALLWACDYVFNTLDLHRLEGHVRTDNQRALHCYEKVGFKTEGVDRECYFYDGVWRDIARIGILAHEWRALKESRGAAAVKSKG